MASRGNNITLFAKTCSKQPWKKYNRKSRYSSQWHSSQWQIVMLKTRLAKIRGSKQATRIKEREVQEQKEMQEQKEEKQIKQEEKEKKQEAREETQKVMPAAERELCPWQPPLCCSPPAGSPNALTPSGGCSSLRRPHSALGASTRCPALSPEHCLVPACLLQDHLRPLHARGQVMCAHIHAVRW